MPIRRPALAIATAILAFSVSACDDLIGLDDAILLENESEASITRVYIRDCDSTDWGVDRLGADEVVGPDESRGFDVDEGCYDLRADFLTGGNTQEHGVEIERDDQYIWRID